MKLSVHHNQPRRIMTHISISIEFIPAWPIDPQRYRHHWRNPHWKKMKELLNKRGTVLL